MSKCNEQVIDIAKAVMRVYFHSVNYKHYEVTIKIHQQIVNFTSQTFS